MKDISIDQILKKSNIGILNKVYSNNRKGRTCYCGIKDGKKVFIKYNDISEKKYWDLLNKEAEIYKIAGRNDCKFIPNAIMIENGFLITEYIENSCTLRAFLKKCNSKEKYANAKSVLAEILVDYARMITLLSSNSKEIIEAINSKNNNELVYEFKTFLHKLLLSGPMDSSVRMGSLTRYRNKLLFKIFDKCIAFFVMKDSKYIPYIIHGDYHMNNILISGNKSFVVDFENVKYGSVEVELAYFSAQVVKLLDDSCKEDYYYSVLEIIRKIGGDEKLFIKIYKFYCFAIRLNPQF